MGGELRYHRVRMGPGKAIVFAQLAQKPIFCLAGGPASCLMGFYKLALPGILRLAGQQGPLFPSRSAVLSRPLRGDRDWTQFYYAKLEQQADGLIAHPFPRGHHLRPLAEAEAIIEVPEGILSLETGQMAQVDVIE